MSGIFLLWYQMFRFIAHSVHKNSLLQIQLSLELHQKYNVSTLERDQTHFFHNILWQVLNVYVILF